MSTLRVNTIQNSGGTGSPAINGLARAWVNFNGTGTVAIRASNNVSSITDNGTGDYTLNFTTAISDANYCVTQSCAQSGDGGAGDDNNANFQPWSYTTSSVRGYTSYTDAKVDCNRVNVAIFR